MGGSQSCFNKLYVAISPWVGDDFKYVGELLISDTNCKMTLSNRSMRGLGSGGSGDATVYEPNKCLLSDQYGSVDVSFVSSNELRHLTGSNSNIQAQLNRVRESTFPKYT